MGVGGLLARPAPLEVLLAEVSRTDAGERVVLRQIERDTPEVVPVAPKRAEPGRPCRLRAAVRAERRPDPRGFGSRVVDRDDSLRTPPLRRRRRCDLRLSAGAVTRARSDHRGTSLPARQRWQRFHTRRRGSLRDAWPRLWRWSSRRRTGATADGRTGQRVRSREPARSRCGTDAAPGRAGSQTRSGTSTAPLDSRAHRQPPRGWRLSRWRSRAEARQVAGFRRSRRQPRTGSGRAQQLRWRSRSVPRDARLRTPTHMVRGGEESRHADHRHPEGEEQNEHLSRPRRRPPSDEQQEDERVDEGSVRGVPRVALCVCPDDREQLEHAEPGEECAGSCGFRTPEGQRASGKLDDEQSSDDQPTRVPRRGGIAPVLPRPDERECNDEKRRNVFGCPAIEERPQAQLPLSWRRSQRRSRSTAKCAQEDRSRRSKEDSLGSATRRPAL